MFKFVIQKWTLTDQANLNLLLTLKINEVHNSIRYS